MRLSVERARCMLPCVYHRKLNTFLKKIPGEKKISQCFSAIWEMILKGANYFPGSLVWGSTSYQLICVLYVLFLNFTFMNHFLFLKCCITPGQISICVGHSSHFQFSLAKKSFEFSAVWLVLHLVFESFVHVPDKVTADKFQTLVPLLIWAIKRWKCAGFQLCFSTRTPGSKNSSLLLGRAPPTSIWKIQQDSFHPGTFPF